MMLEVIAAILVGKVQIGPNTVQYDYLLDNSQVVSYVVREEVSLK